MDVEGEQDGKSDAAERDVPFLDPLARELAAHKLRAPHSAPGDLVFGLTADRPFYPSTVRRRALEAWGWKEAANPEPGGPRRVLVQAREDALEPIGLHEGRHTCASILIASGANAKVIQRVMGHATITMTFDRYGHLMPGGLEEAAAAANAYLTRLRGRGELMCAPAARQWSPETSGPNRTTPACRPSEDPHEH